MQDTATRPGPIDDITILDLTAGIAGPYATKLLADFGANVIKVEPPGGDPTRQLPPFAGDTPGIEQSGTFFYFNTNKRSVVLDLETEAGREHFWRLAMQADAIVESFPPGTMEGLGIGWAEIARRRTDLPLVSITNFGQDSPYKGYKGTDLVLYGFGGEMYTMGIAEREPVKMYGTAALVQSGSALSTAIMAAVVAAREQGKGQHVDFSMADSHLLGADRRHAVAIAWEFARQRGSRRAGDARGTLAGVYPCKDGFVELTAASLRMDRLRKMLGNPEWLQDPKWDAPAVRSDADLGAEFEAYFLPWLYDHTKAEIWAKAREARVLCGPLFTTDELFHDPHFRDRGFWIEAETREMGSFEIPGAPFKMPKSPWRYRRGAPHLGEHTAEVLAEAEKPRRLPDATGKALSTPELPLGNLRVLDICVVWAGPFSTLLLGDLGAEVLKIENPFMMQPMTRGTIARPPKLPPGALAPMAGAYPRNDPAPRAWNYNPTFVQLYRNKKSFTVDIRRPEGRELLRRVIEKTDAVVENNATETMEKLGITYDWMRSIKPDIIMLRIPAYGSTGPYNQARALGVHLESVMGHTILRGYADLDPSASTPIFSGDYLAGAQACLAVMMAAWHRKKTGEGQLMELCQAENAAAMLAQSFMDYSLNGRVQERIGNRSIFGHAPTNTYPCKAVGPTEDCGDRWISIDVTTDEEWQALVEVMGRPVWAMNPEYATREGRLAEHDEIDACIREWTADRDDYELFHQLQQAGVPAAPVLEVSRVYDDAHVQHRDLFQPQTLYDDVGTYRFATPFYRMPATPITVRQPPVAFGEHNDYVYRELLGLSDEEYQAYVDGGHVTMDFDPSVP